MRNTTFTVRNNQMLEVFTKRHGPGFELWTVGLIKERRSVLSHYLTHDDLEARLAYAEVGDLLWRNATIAEIPNEKHTAAAQWEESLRRGVFVDNDMQQRHSVASHFDVINLLPLDRKTWNIAKNVILGKWTDGNASVCFEPQSKLQWSCPMERPHLLNRYARVDGRIPDWWSFASWQLHLMNSEHKCGIRVGVLRVDQNELHLLSDQQDHLSHIMKRP